MIPITTPLYPEVQAFRVNSIKELKGLIAVQNARRDGALQMLSVVPEAYCPDYAKKQVLANTDKRHTTVVDITSNDLPEYRSGRVRVFQTYEELVIDINVDDIILFVCTDSETNEDGCRPAVGARVMGIIPPGEISNESSGMFVSFECEFLLLLNEQMLADLGGNLLELEIGLDEAKIELPLSEVGL